MKIYLAMIDDQHADTEAHPFSTAEKAIEYAKAVAVAGAHRPEDFAEHETPAGWLYYAKYSCESDAVWVVERELDSESRKSYA